MAVLAWVSLPPIPAFSSCIASAGTDAGGQHYEAGAKVTLDPDGKAASAR
jgi:hypothetical protein